MLNMQARSLKSKTEMTSYSFCPGIDVTKTLYLLTTSYQMDQLLIQKVNSDSPFIRPFVWITYQQ